MVKQFVGYITVEEIAQYKGHLYFAVGWMYTAQKAAERGNKLVVYEVGQDSLSFDVRGTDFDCGDIDGVYSLDNTSVLIMPPDGIGNG